MAAVFVPCVVCLSLLTLTVWLALTLSGAVPESWYRDEPGSPGGAGCLALSRMWHTRHRKNCAREKAGQRLLSFCHGCFAFYRKKYLTKQYVRLFGFWLCFCLFGVVCKSVSTYAHVGRTFRRPGTTSIAFWKCREHPVR